MAEEQFDEETQARLRRIRASFPYPPQPVAPPAAEDAWFSRRRRGLPFPPKKPDDPHEVARERGLGR